jgi:type I restriction enzyme R subunit
LKQGIEDGFLAPYKVIRIAMDKDSGWRPEDGKVDKYGYKIPDQIYNMKDYDRNLVLEKRTERVAEKVTELLKKTDRFGKTIIFCEDIDHAERMQMAIVNENSDEVAKNYKYVMRITGDNEEGKMELDNFITPESRYPVIATTSKLLSTGVDTQTCKLIVLDKNIDSMTEFKQIIGRGTRINEEFNKYYFTIMDFRQATNLFADPLFDGEPVQIYEPGEDDPVEPPDPLSSNGDDVDDDYVVIDDSLPELHELRRKLYIDDVEVFVEREQVQYYGDDGKLITESLKDFTKKRILKEYASLDDFLRQWKKSEKKQAIIEELMEQGILLYELQEEVGKDFDPFDLICHVAFEQPALTRRERANNVKKKSYFTKYGDNARAVLDALLDKYADEGIENLESMEVLKIKPFDEFGSPVEIIKSFGGKEQYLQAVKELETQIYEVAA